MRHYRLEISLVALITVIAFTAQSVVTVMPRIVAYFDYEQFYPVVFGLYPCGQIIATVISGMIADARGSKGVFIFGMITYAISIVTCALSPTIFLFSAGRFILGISAGATNVAVYMIVAKKVPRRHQPRLFAWLSAAWVIPSVAGPAIGGYVAQSLGWRWLFWIIAIALIPLLPAMKATSASSDHHPGILPSNYRFMLSVSALAGVALAAVQAGQALGSIGTIVAAISAVLAVWALHKILPTGTLTLRHGVPAVIATRGLLMGAYLGYESFLPHLFQDYRGWTPGQSGLLIACGAITWASGSFILARIKDERTRIRTVRAGTIVLTVSIVVAASGSFLVVPAATVLIAWMCAGLGVGLSYPALAVYALALTPPSKHGAVSADITLADSVGMAMSMAAVSGLYNLALGVGGPVPYLAAALVAFVIACLSIVSAFHIPQLDPAH